MVTAPRQGPCAPWISADDILALKRYEKADAGTAATMATVASEVLYLLSGQQWTGVCGPVEVRPVSRPIDADTRFMASLAGAGYLSSWGTCTAYGTPMTGGVAHYGCSNPPEVELGAYPIVEIETVKIDGVPIPPNEYRLENYRTLVRVRPTAAATPTQRYGWPTCQLMDLPDTELGTFSITYKYGVAPPAGGVMAASVLGGELALSAGGDNSSRLPRRITNVSRQGVSAAVVDAQDFLVKRKTGIYEVDLWLWSVNPTGALKRPGVWSPDIAGRPRRMPAGST